MVHSVIWTARTHWLRYISWEKKSLNRENILWHVDPFLDNARNTPTQQQKKYCMNCFLCCPCHSHCYATGRYTQTRGIIGDLLLGNGEVNRLCQQYRLCFPLGQCKVDIRESNFEAGSCGRTRMRIGGAQRSKTEYNEVSLRKEDFMHAVVTLRLL
jgi:hypothetical protein